MNLPVSNSGVLLEKITALVDAKWMIDERGAEIKYYPRGESKIQRDAYDSIKGRTIVDAIVMNAFPIETNPLEKQLMKAGLRETHDVVITTAMQDWINNDINLKIDIDIIRSTIVVDGVTYNIKEIGFVNQFSDTHLNITFGLARR